MMPPRLRRHIGAWRRLQAADKMLAAEAVTLLCIVRACLFVVPFRAFLKLMKPGATARSQPDEARLRRRTVIARTVAAVANYVPGASCLTRSIVLFHMLKRRGDCVVLQIGVSKAVSGFEAHAWVESDDGLCLIGNDTRGCTTLLAVRS
jgi:hypothetical protein